jgi:hypothetical protein
MRYLILRRKIVFSLIAVTLLLSLSGYIFYTHGNLFLDSVRGYLEKQLSAAFKAKVEIYEIKAGFFKGIILENVKISSLKQGLRLPEFCVKEACINYRLWDILLKRFDRLSEIRFLNPSIDFCFAQDSPVAESYTAPSTFWPKPESALPVPLSKQWLASFFSPTVNYLPKQMEFSVQDGKVFFTTNAPLLNDVNGLMTLRKEGVSLENFQARLWSIMLSGKGKLEDLASEPKIDLSLRSESAQFDGELKINGLVNQPSLSGFLKTEEGKEINFLGDLDFRQNGMEITQLLVCQTSDSPADLKQPQIKLKGFIRPDKLALEIDLEHWQFAHQDFLTDLAVSGQVGKDTFGRSCIKGKLNTTNTIINFHPLVQELVGEFELNGQSLVVNYLKYGENLHLSGAIGLTQPHEINLTVDFKDMPIKQLFEFFSEKDLGALSGLISGTLKVSGSAKNLYVAGHLDARNGVLGDTAYTSAIFNFSGFCPVLDLYDSRISKDQSYYLLNGKMDFRCLGKENFLKGLDVKSGEGSVSWQGWDVTKEKNSREVLFGKDLANGKVHLGYKAYLDNGQILENKEANAQNELKLEYHLFPDKNIQLNLQKNEQYLGLEHKKEF